MTNVIYRKFPDGDVIALFPDEPYSKTGTMITSYMHIGQHSAASPDLITDLEPANEQEYAPLHAELTAIGYSDLHLSQMSA